MDNITQAFYNSLAHHYDKLFLNWDEATREQAVILDKIFCDYGIDKSSSVLDCACGIGTQAIGLAALGYSVTASDFSENAIAEAKKRASDRALHIQFERADFCALSECFDEQFDIVIALDNALPHMLTKADLESAVNSISAQTKENGIFVASIRDYDALLADKPPYSPPYIHKTESGKRVSFQVWEWEGENYRLTQYIIDDECELQVNKFECEYRATLRGELTDILQSNGFRCIEWLFPETTGFYQPIVVARK